LKTTIRCEVVKTEEILHEMKTNVKDLQFQVNFSVSAARRQH